VRIEKISDNKIKIVIEAADIRVWNVDLKNFTDNTPEAQNMFWHVLKQAERDVHFCVGKAQLMVETVPSADNGFIMLISKLENEAEFTEALIKAGKRIRQVEFKVKRRSKPFLRIFRFEDFDALCDGVKEIHEFYVGESRLIKYHGAFYLEFNPSDDFGLFEIDNILSEFAQKIKNPVVTQGVLNEHGLIMIESSAVSRIADNFVK